MNAPKKVKSWLNKSLDSVSLSRCYGELRSVSTSFCSAFKIRDEKWNESSSVIQELLMFFDALFP